MQNKIVLGRCHDPWASLGAPATVVLEDRRLSAHAGNLLVEHRHGSIAASMAGASSITMAREPRGSPWLGLSTVQSIDSASPNSMAGACGTIKWCYSMRKLASEPYLAGIAEVVVLTNNASLVRSWCSSSAQGQARRRGFRVVPLDRALRPLIEGWSRMLNYSRASWFRSLSLHALYKLQLWRLTEYRVLLYTDADVDPFLFSAGQPPASHRGERERAFTVGLQSFLQSDVQLTASSDYHSPINTGVMLLKPNASLFARGLAILRRRQFDRERGFDAVGRPRDALSHFRRSSEMWRVLNHTRMLAANDWDFIGGHAGQGLFVYLFLVLHTDETNPRFRFPRSLAYRREHRELGTMRVHHFRGGAKPWKPGARCPTYFTFLRELDATRRTQVAVQQDSGGGGNGGDGADYCWSLLRAKRHCLSRPLNQSACGECKRRRFASSCDQRASKGVKEKCDGTDVLVF